VKIQNPAHLILQFVAKVCIAVVVISAATAYIAESVTIVSNSQLNMP
jgi:hypothetical protein